MNKEELECILISDFNIDILKGYLDNDLNRPAINATVVPFGQVIPTLIDKELECWKRKYDIAVVWTQPQAVIESFGHSITYQQVSMDQILAEVQEYSRLLSGLQNRVNCIFVPTWVLPSYYRGFGLLDMKKNIGVKITLLKMNIALSEALDNEKNIYLLDSERWVESVGSNSFNSKMWYLAKSVFDIKVFKEASEDIRAALNGIMGLARKIIVLDLDDTLWGGVLGDLGYENIVLGGHDPAGEAFVDFQKALKSLLGRGILLAIVSKNNEQTAMEAINNHPEMILKANDFVGWKINWGDKAKNIVDLISELNLGLQSVVFIDDNPMERARVREALPEVFVPEWPEDKMLYKEALLGLRCFDAPALNKEDLERTKMYVDDHGRQDLKVRIGSLEEWLQTLDIKVKIENLDEVNLQRTAQLLNKTNQMNLSTRRITEKELMDWTRGDNRKLWVFSVSDKFGSLGLTGIISLEMEGKTGQIVDFVLSCRVFGRKIEEAMVSTAVTYARSIGLERLLAKYMPTSKNKPCFEFWQRSGFKYDEKENIFSWGATQEYAMPKVIKII